MTVQVKSVCEWDAEAVGGAVELAPPVGALEVRPSSRPGRRAERGMVSAEWAVGIIAAIALAGVVLAIVTSGPVHDLLLNVILEIIGKITKA